VLKLSQPLAQVIGQAWMWLCLVLCVLRCECAVLFTCVCRECRESLVLYWVCGFGSCCCVWEDVM
jgi:hypothetical protein